MSHYRNLGGGRRDTNEPEIMRRFRHHGWHPEQVSGNRLWDLNVYPPRKPTLTLQFTLVCHVDVKGPKGKVEEAQREKWAALSAKGIPVYVVRTEADVDALVRGDLEPWRPETTRQQSKLRGGRARANHARLAAGMSVHASITGNYTPPRSEPVDAAKEAAETFAPPAASARTCEFNAPMCMEPAAYGTRRCAEHTP